MKYGSDDVRLACCLTSAELNETAPCPRGGQLWALVVGLDDSGRHAALDGCRTKCSFSSANLSRTESRVQVGNRHLHLG